MKCESNDEYIYSVMTHEITKERREWEMGAIWCQWEIRRTRGGSAVREGFSGRDSG